MFINPFRRRTLFLYPGVDILSITEIPYGKYDVWRRKALETGRSRLSIIGSMFLLIFSIIAVRLVEVTISGTSESIHRSCPVLTTKTTPMNRADIVDRNGVILATSLPTVNLYADPKSILDPEEAARKIVAALPEINFNEVLEKLSSNKSFVYIKRNLIPSQQYEINNRGIPGLFFEKGERRVYPYSTLIAHVIGGVDVDNHGISGVEKTFDEQLTKQLIESLRLSIDVRLQHIIREELVRSIGEFHAIGGTGIISDVHTGEVLAMVSLPDFNPNSPVPLRQEVLFNRATLGVYEMGSTFKLFTATAAIDGGFAKLESSYDATMPIKVANFTIKDYHPQRRWLTVPEIMIHSSNIGAAKMAQDIGTRAMKSYLLKLGLLQPLSIELPETGKPLVPTPWREINTLTIAYGHGLAVTSVHMATAVSTLVNGGIYRPATLIYHSEHDPEKGERVLKMDTSRKMRWLMREVVEKGTGAKAEVSGYFVGGKTGTAEKNRNGSYASKALLSSFAAVFPMDEPRYTIIVIIDEPEGNKSTFGYATGGWTAAPLISRIVAQMAPVVGIAPIHTGWNWKKNHPID